MSDILAKLAAPFPPDVISWRIGSTTQDKSKGMALAYLDSRDVQDRLNAVCGTDWQVRHPWADGKKLACEIGIKIDGEWIWRGDGAGDSDVEAEKGAFSDSFKRAAVRWGIGRYLYDVDSPWVQIEAHGRSYSIAKHELGKLRDLLYRIGKTAAATAKPEAPKLAASNEEIDPEAEWRAIGEQIKHEIDNAKNVPAINDILVGRTLENLTAHSSAAGKFLRDRAEKRVSVIISSGQGKAA